MPAGRSAPGCPRGVDPFAVPQQAATVQRVQPGIPLRVGGKLAIDRRVQALHHKATAFMLGNFPHSGPHGIFNAIGQVPAKAENCRCQCQPPPKHGMALRCPALRHLRMGHHLPPLYFPRSPCYARQSKKVSQTPKIFKKSVDKYPTPCYNNTCRRLKSQPRQSIWGFSSAGRALAWHARGHRFDPGNLHQTKALGNFAGRFSFYIASKPPAGRAAFSISARSRAY